MRPEVLTTLVQLRSRMSALPRLPRRIGGIAVPQDEVSAATWAWANRSLPRYLLAHSVRAYCWGAAIGVGEGWRFDRRILWTSSLFHDNGLRRLGRNTMCFEVEGAERARRLLVRMGMAADEAERVAIAIILHMLPGVTLDDGVEAVLLDRATGLDVRGAEFGLVHDVREAVVRAYPRGDFDRRFLDAIGREAAVRRDCQSARFSTRPASRRGWPGHPGAARSKTSEPRTPAHGSVERGQRTTITDSRYSLGTTIVPSSARLNCAMFSSRSASRAARPSSPTASNAFNVGP